MHFVVRGRDLDPRKVERAIALSVEKYCSAVAMLAKTATITHDFELAGPARRAAGRPHQSSARALNRLVHPPPPTPRRVPCGGRAPRVLAANRADCRAAAGRGADAGAAPEPQLVSMGPERRRRLLPVGVALCRLVNQHRRDPTCAAPPGSPRLRRQRDRPPRPHLDLAIIQSDIQAAALAGSGTFASAGPSHLGA